MKNYYSYLDSEKNLKLYEQICDGKRNQNLKNFDLDNIIAEYEKELAEIGFELLEQNQEILKEMLICCALDKSFMERIDLNILFSCLKDQNVYELTLIIDVLEEAVRQGNLDFVQYLIFWDMIPGEYEELIELYSNLMRLAAECGQDEIVKCFIEWGIDVSLDVLYIASVNGNLPLVEYLVGATFDLEKLGTEVLEKDIDFNFSDDIKHLIKKGNFNQVRFSKALVKKLKRI